MTFAPRFAVLKGTAGEKINQTITVVPGDQEAIKILSTNTLNKTDFKYSMTEIEKDGEKAYQFLIENIKTSPGRYTDKIFIYTNIMERNPVTIIVRGDIKPAISENKTTGEVQPGKEQKTN